jgi:glyoxylase-like metal-dependent hydrolase (beta-lactamase superfamily II)
MVPRIDHVVTSGTFQLDGGSWDVENNVWVVGNDVECVVIDAPHDPRAIVDAVHGRKVTALLLTHAHNDHINAAQQVAEALKAPVYLHPDDLMLWRQVHDDGDPAHVLQDGDSFDVAGATLTALHTPGHSPGSTCFYLRDAGVVFTGDTLFAGGPGATGRSYSDFPTIISSIRSRLLTLPSDTVVHTGHGPSTTIGAEAPHLQEWIARGH